MYVHIYMYIHMYICTSGVDIYIYMSGIVCLFKVEIKYI